jgi:hypothetical protein
MLQSVVSTCLMIMYKIDTAFATSSCQCMHLNMDVMTAIEINAEEAEHFITEYDVRTPYMMLLTSCKMQCLDILGFQDQDETDTLKSVSRLPRD